MSDINQLHEQAMELADEAFLAKREGQHDQAKKLFRRAFELESEAAELVRNDLSAEPTRSILYRSAATLAIDCGELREAKRLLDFIHIVDRIETAGYANSNPTAKKG